MAEPVVTISKVGKKFSTDMRTSLWAGVRDVCKEFGYSPSIGSDQLGKSEFWALHDICTSLQPGDALGLMGKNGAGKSTLLKMLAGIIKPDIGEIRLRGRVAALLELGAGFDPVLTGRENIFVNAAILGLSHRETVRIFDSVVDFAGVSQFLDSPVQYYSSGMYVRLAYAIAAHVQPDILLVDEVLAVGDFSFQQKCLADMRQYVAQGGTLIVVSHSAFHLQSVCNRGLVIDGARVAFDGRLVEALQFYEALLSRQRLAGQEKCNSARSSGGAQASQVLTITKLEVAPESGGVVTSGSDFEVDVHFQALADLEGVTCIITIWTDDGSFCLGAAVARGILQMASGEGVFRCRILKTCLTPRCYQLRLAVGRDFPSEVFALRGWLESADTFEVRAPAGEIQPKLGDVGYFIEVPSEWTCHNSVRQ